MPSVELQPCKAAMANTHGSGRISDPSVSSFSLAAPAAWGALLLATILLINCVSAGVKRVTTSSTRAIRIVWSKSRQSHIGSKVRAIHDGLHGRQNRGALVIE